MGTKKEIIHLPNSELEVMMAVWEAKKPVSRTEMEELLDKDCKWAPTTLLKFLSRLTEKGFLSREAMADGKKNLYTALVSEEEYVEFESGSVIGKLCGRSVKSLIANLYENNTISASELDELQEFIKSAKQNS